MKIVTAAEMREIDRRTSEQFGVPSLQLMENAGAAVAAFALARYSHATSFGVICGKGNNGGDGFVTARHLRAAGRHVHVLLLAPPAELTGDAAVMFRRARIKPVLAHSVRDLTRPAAQRVYACDVLLDAILGTGFRPPLKPLHRAAIAELARSPRPLVAVDLPSGLEADSTAADASAVIAPATDVVTFTAPRPALVLNPASAKMRTVVAHIGSPPAAIRSRLNLEVITAPDLAPALLPRAPDSHKGDYGHVLVIAGSLGKAGAAALAGIAALRAGAGLVTVAAPRSVLAQIAGFAPELMTEPLPETSVGSLSTRAVKELERLLPDKTVVAMGPGLSTHPETIGCVREFVSSCSLPLVLDADALNAFAGARRLRRFPSSCLVLTPHPGEMARLVGASTREVQAQRVALARSFARDHGVTLLLKGYRTLVTAGEEVWINPTGNPAMAKGGMGDVLTGMVAALLAQSAAKDKVLADKAPRTRSRQKVRRSPVRAAGSAALVPALAAVYLHGLAGDLACGRFEEHTVLPSDLLHALPRAFHLARERAREPLVRIT